MIKEDNLGHTNTFDLMLRGAGSLHLKNCKMGRKAGNL